MILYQFPLSHYCEKVRWALDYKKIPFQIRNLIPGPHLFITKRLGPKTSVPILTDGEKNIQDSTLIIDYLDTQYPEHSLTPSDLSLKKEALELEEYFDKNIGVHLRRFAYYHLLQENSLVTSLLLQEAPSYSRPFYKLFFPIVKQLMKKTMNIYEEPSKKSLHILENTITELNRMLANKKFLVGNQFSRADLTAAALLGPLCTPAEYAFDWPSFEQMPAPIREFRKTHEGDPFFRWVIQTYQENRKN